MFAATLALTASIIADELLDLTNHDPHLFQQNVAKECRKAFRAQFTNLHMVTPDPPTPKRPPKPH